MNCREVKACGAVREHLRYITMRTLLLSSGTCLRYMFTKPGSMGDKQEDLQVRAQSQGWPLSGVTETWWDHLHLECYSVWIQALQERQAGKADYQKNTLSVVNRHYRHVNVL